MIKSNLFNLLFAIIFLFGAFSIANAQDGEPPPGANEFAPVRPNLLKELGLTKEQIQQLRRINGEWNPRRQKAQRDLNEAKRDLDEAIYLSETGEAEINQRKEGVKRAHSELINTQTTMQTLIRKVLTNDQLAKFRQLRQQFAQRQNNQNNRPLNRQNVKNQRLENQPNNQNRRLENQRNNQPARPLPKRILRPNQRP